MLKEDQAWVIQIVKEEIAKIQFPIPKTPKPVEVDIDGIVKLVLDNIKLSTSTVATEAPKKGKEK